MTTSPKQKLAAIEAELDQIWPRWREKPSIKPLPLEYQARLKWLLKRRALLQHETAGVPTPRDWPVRIITMSQGSVSGKPVVIAQVVEPDLGGVPWSEDLLAGPPTIDASMVVNTESPSMLAERIRVPLETVEDLLPHVPEGQDPGEWIRKQAGRRRRRGGR